MSKESAVEMMVFKPTNLIPPEKRGVHENLWIKQRVKQYVSIGVYLNGSNLNYYFFEDCDNTPKIYNSLVELKKDSPSRLKNIFEKTPKLFIMGHGHGGLYGLSNIHGPSEQIYDANFDKIITDFETALPEQHSQIFVTLEACNTDNQALAAEKGQSKTFLERLSEKHPQMIFCGTGPWEAKSPETGYRASGGFPILNVPITATGGGIWKHGNSVIFYQENYQIAVKKSMFASTKTAQALKINTVAYAREFLKKTSLDSNTREALIKKICLNREILNIEDLGKAPDFPQEKYENPELKRLIAEEKRILKKEKNNYITRIQKILACAKPEKKLAERDLLIIALGLKDFPVSKHLSIFKDHEDVRDKILTNKELLQLIMVACGKTLIASPSNDSLINLLLERHIDINSVDEKGMTALHYAVQNFYNYRKEPLNLIRKLLDSGANLRAKDTKGRTPLMLAIAHSRKETVISGENLRNVLKQKQIDAISVKSYDIEKSTSTQLRFFKTLDAGDGEQKAGKEQSFTLDYL